MNNPFKTRTAALLSGSIIVGALALAGCTGGGGSTTTSSGVTVGATNDVVATVGGQDITRGELNAFLEAAHGEELLPQLIDLQLVMQNLKTKGLDVTDAEVQAQLDQLVKENPRIEEVVKKGGPRLQQLKQQQRFQLAMQKLLTQDIKVDEAKVKEWFAKHTKWYDQPAKAKFGVLLSSTKVRADVLAAQLTKKSKTFKELVEEQKKANDPIAGGSTETTPEMAPLENLPPEMSKALNQTAVGGNSGVVPISLPGLPTKVFAIFHVAEREAAKKADYASMKDKATTDYKLYQVAEQVSKQNPGNPPFDQTLLQTADYMKNQQGGQVDFRAVLNFINQTAANNLVASLRNAGNVSIKDTNYATVGEQYKMVPGASDNAAPAPSENGAPAPAEGGTENAAPAPAENAAPAANEAPAKP